MRNSIDGFWYLYGSEQQPSLSHFRTLYNANYSKKLGLLKTDMDMDSLVLNFTALSDHIYLYNNNSERVFAYNASGLTECPQTLAEITDVTVPINRILIEDINCELIQVLSMDSFTYNGFMLIGVMFALFLLLSLVYYFIAASITQRLARLKDHIMTTDTQQLTPYPGNIYGDEIGQLTDTYNHMIENINQLIHQNYHMELEKKDAQFYAMQAQINPHFLYNILENTHMTAQKNGDLQIADMVLSLGRFMRYNLNNSMKPVPLTDELRHAENYLNIHKVRLKEKLEIDQHLISP